MNLATERATVTVDPTRVGRPEVVAAVEAAGYDVRPEAPETALLDVDPDEPARIRERRDLLIKAVVSIAVAAVLMHWDVVVAVGGGEVAGTGIEAARREAGAG